MIRTRTKFYGNTDMEIIEDSEAPTAFRTDQNQYHLRCEVCDEVNYVSETFLENFNEVLEQGFDNPFFCTECEQEYEELEYEA